jgi:hypothetical protein
MGVKGTGSRCSSIPPLVPNFYNQTYVEDMTSGSMRSRPTPTRNESPIANALIATVMVPQNQTAPPALRAIDILARVNQERDLTLVDSTARRSQAIELGPSLSRSGLLHSTNMEAALALLRHQRICEQERITARFLRDANPLDLAVMSVLLRNRADSNRIPEASTRIGNGSGVLPSDLSRGGV